MHQRESRTSKFSGGACPRTPLGSKALKAFGKYTRLFLLSTHLCKNLLKPLVMMYNNEDIEMKRSNLNLAPMICPWVSEDVWLVVPDEICLIC